MNNELIWLGHNFWRLRLGKTVFAVDPFFTPQTREATDRVVDDVPEIFHDGDSMKMQNVVKTDYVLLSHGHVDHCAEAQMVLTINDATLIAIAEVATWFRQKGCRKVEPMNVGGSLRIKTKTPPYNIRVLMVSASHSSTLPDGTPGGNAVGFLVSFPKMKNGGYVNNDVSIGFSKPFRPLSEIMADCHNIYFACDTGWTAEMPWIGRLGIDLAVLPIGDRYTMGPELSLDAIAALKPKTVIPGHFNTWPPVAQDAEAWADAVCRQGIAEPVVLSGPLDRYTF